MEREVNTEMFNTAQRTGYELRPVLSASINRKGVVDVDTVKGCAIGMAMYPHGGCYGECYARKTAATYGRDFSVSVSRRPNNKTLANVFNTVRSAPLAFYRIGVFGDPSHDWDNTVHVCELLRKTGKVPVIVTKHWRTASDQHLKNLAACGCVFNTSVSGLDTDGELSARLHEARRADSFGITSVLRVVTARFGASVFARECHEKQGELLSHGRVINNPLRARAANPLAISGDIILTKRADSVGGGKSVSLCDDGAYLGVCENCPDQCGIIHKPTKRTRQMEQVAMFDEGAEFEYLPTVIGSGYEQDVAKLALEDGIAERAARKNMQIHSAIVLKIGGEFSGFFTFQNNHDVREFCLLQSVIKPEKYTADLYLRMVLAVLDQNTNSYPALITVNPRSKFETPAVFKSVGFRTYLNMSGFEYMVNGRDEDIRMKILAHITMTNTWNSIKGDWLRLKKEWNARIEAAGERERIPNPTFATREGCWQGESGFANVVTGRSHNGNASVLDPVACEVILRFFMPTAGRRVYNPFGGGVQFGYVTGAYGYEYLASEIRQNQCDANNALCSEFGGVKWERGDSSVYHPEGMFDLVFTCPPYYRVERYIDYDDSIPDGEINALDTYEKFRDALFSGYEIALDHLNENSFFVVMTGDSRGKDGGYHCHESETEVFMKEHGLLVYNKIIYLEAEFTRLAQAKKTLDHRKFPKREQKIIVGFKGDPSKIKSLYPSIGRL